MKDSSSVKLILFRDYLDEALELATFEELDASTFDPVDYFYKGKYEALSCAKRYLDSLDAREESLSLSDLI